MAVVPPSAEGTCRCSLVVISQSHPEISPGSPPQEGTPEKTVSGRGRDSWPSFRQVRRGLTDVPSA